MGGSLLHNDHLGEHGEGPTMKRPKCRRDNGQAALLTPRDTRGQALHAAVKVDAGRGASVKAHRCGE